MENIDYISPIREDLEKVMHKHCTLFTTIGSGSVESPRWFNYDGDHEGVLYIRSTQCPIGFHIDLPKNYPEIGGSVDLFWRQFKKFRTEFLLENYPTINAY